MPALDLPEELLHEVLNYHFTVPHEQFFRFSKRHPEDDREYQSPRVSSSVVLRVSKRWLRIGTPLLYVHLHLFKQAHTRSIAKILHDNPQLGKAIRYVRLEGGLGKELCDVIRLAPNIEAVYIGLVLHSKDSVTGFRRSMKLMNPSTLYIMDRCRRDNQQIQELMRLACVGIGEWTSLKRCFALEGYYALKWRIKTAIQDKPTLQMSYVPFRGVLAGMDGGN